MYSPTYEEILDGTFSKNWRAAQAPNLPKHLIDSNEPPITCTCGARLNSITEWASHAVGR